MAEDEKIQDIGDIEKILEMLDEHSKGSREKLDLLRRKAQEAAAAHAAPVAPARFRCPKCGEMIDLGAVHGEVCAPAAGEAAGQTPAPAQEILPAPAAVETFTPPVSAEAGPAAAVPAPAVTSVAPETPPPPAAPGTVPVPAPQPASELAAPQQPAPAKFPEAARRPGTGKKLIPIAAALLLAAGGAYVYMRRQSAPALPAGTAAAPGTAALQAAVPQAAQPVPVVPQPAPAAAAKNMPPVDVEVEEPELDKPEKAAKAEKLSKPPRPAHAKAKTPARAAAQKSSYALKDRYKACTAVWAAGKNGPIPAAEASAGRKYDCEGLKDNMARCEGYEENVRSMQSETPEQRAADAQKVVMGWTVKKQVELDKRTVQAYNDAHCAELSKLAGGN